MEVVGTKEAFLSLISQKGFAKSFGFNKATAAVWKKRPPTLDKMEEILYACGALVKQEKVWHVNSSKPEK